MNPMKYHLFFIGALLLVFASCKKDQMVPEPRELTDYDLEVIEYFKDIALGFEFGGASRITRKWGSKMTVYVGGRPTLELLDELEQIRTEINTLATDGFTMEVVSDSTQANYYLFFGSADEYAEIYPGQADLAESNWGLFNVFWNGNNHLNRGYMYVDIERADPTAQKHLLREELTQSLGLARDSDAYPESIFQASWTTTTEYAMIDEDLIRLLYHPEMPVGLSAMQADAVLRDILEAE
jgi:hypothetical protein